MPRHIECVAAYFLYNVAHYVGIEILRSDVVKDFRKGFYGGVGGVHKYQIARFEILCGALVNQIGILVTPINRVVRPHYHRIAKVFASVEHCV